MKPVPARRLSGAFILTGRGTLSASRSPSILGQV